MSSTSKRKSTSAQKSRSRAKVQAHRDRLRSLGLRPIQFWVPDLRLPKFAGEARRQSLRVASSSHAEEDQSFIEAVSEPATE